MNEIRRPDRDAEELARIGEIVTQHTFPEGVVGFELRPGYDHMDEPAVWIVFHTDRDLPADEAEAHRWLAELNALTDVVRDHVLESGVRRFPYFRFE